MLTLTSANPLSLLCSSNSSFSEKGQAGERRHCPRPHPTRSVQAWCVYAAEQRLLSLNRPNLCVLLGSLEDSLLPQSSQVQAAEDILDKYRNIKRTSPSNGATGGTSYDGTGGKSLAPSLFSTLWYQRCLICPH